MLKGSKLTAGCRRDAEGLSEGSVRCVTSPEDAEDGSNA